MWVYKFFSAIVKMGLLVYFRKIYFYGAEKVSMDKPVLIASNHPTAFIEPLIIGSTVGKPIHYLVRADIFRDGIIKFFTDAFHMIPIYRFVDGYSNLKNNQEIFRMLYKKLSEGNIIVVFAEGNTTQQKRLKSIKKGTARMAFGAYEKYGVEDIDIIPTGVNYTYPNQLRKEVMVEFGEPIRMSDYMDIYHEHPNRAIMQVTKELQKRMHQYVICVTDKNDDVLAEQQFVLNRSERIEKILPIKTDTNVELKSEWQIATAINEMDETAKADLKTRTQSYFDKLAQHKLTDRSVYNGNQRFNIFRTLFLFIGFIPFAIGVIPVILPLFFSEQLIKAKVKSLEFEAPIRFTVSLGQYFFLWVFSMIFALIFWNPFLIGFLIVLPFLTWFAATYADVLRGWNEDRRVVFASKEIVEKLKVVRKELLL